MCVRERVCADFLFNSFSRDHKVKLFKFVFQEIKEAQHLSSTLCIFANFFFFSILYWHPEGCNFMSQENK